MKLHSKSKILLLVLAICVVFSIATVETLIAIEMLHDCTNVSCQPCLRIETMQGFLNAFKQASLAFIAIGFLILFIGIINKYTKLNPSLLSPILLKVRLNS